MAGMAKTGTAYVGNNPILKYDPTGLDEAVPPTGYENLKVV
jgi:hypothetical protein